MSAEHYCLTVFARWRHRAPHIIQYTILWVFAAHHAKRQHDRFSRFFLHDRCLSKTIRYKFVRCRARSEPSSNKWYLELTTTTIKTAPRSGEPFLTTHARYQRTDRQNDNGTRPTRTGRLRYICATWPNKMHEYHSDIIRICSFW